MWFWFTFALSGLVGNDAALERKVTRAIAFKAFAYTCLVYALLQASVGESFIGLVAIVGVLTSLVADILLFVQQRFRLSFVLITGALLLYGWALWLRVGTPSLSWLPALLFALAIVLFLLFLPHLGRSWIPAAAITLTSIQLAWAAIEWWMMSSQIATVLGVIGVFLIPIVAILLGLQHTKNVLWREPRVSAAIYLLANGLIIASLL